MNVLVFLVAALAALDVVELAIFAEVRCIESVSLLGEGVEASIFEPEPAVAMEELGVEV